MTFADYYSKKNYYSKLSTGITNRLRKGPSQADCDKLQVFLQDTFYPKINGQINTGFIDNVIMQAYEKEQGRAITNFQLGAPTHTFEEVGKIARERYDHTTHNTRIEADTIRTRINKVKQLIERIAQNADTKDLPVIEQQLTELKNLQMSMEQFLSKYASDGSNIKIDLKFDQKALEWVTYLDQMYEKYLSKSISAFIPKDYGDILEYALNALNIPLDQLTGNIADHLVDKIVGTQGSARIGRQHKLSIAKSGKDFGTKGNDLKEQHISVGQGDSYFEFSFTPTLNYDARRQGKADVILNIGFGDSSAFRISAKNWQDLNRDFGQTSLAYALLRSLESGGARYYAYVMQDKNAGTRLQEAHNMAKLAIVADILMGYSQANAYADTLVINVRAGQNSRVIVKSLKDIFTKLQSEINTFTLKDYQDRTIENRLQTISKDVHKKMKTNRSKTYSDLALGYLNTINIAVRYEDLFEKT